MNSSFHEILVQLILSYNQKYSKGISKTKLLKLTYLVELFYYRKFQERLLETKWIYYLYGPWIAKYDNEISKYPFTQEKVHFEEPKETNILDIESE